LTSPAAHPSAGNILARLSDERDALRAFVVLLEREQEILLGTDTDALLPLAEQKTRASDDIHTRARERRQSLPDSVSTEKWLQANSPTGLALWHEVRQLAEQAQRQNHLNGELIQIKMRYNQQALVALVGATQHAAGIYGADGQPALPSSGRTLGSG
jgi:flagella synthesis protein FlgN